jgi:hypothetical protein
MYSNVVAAELELESKKVVTKIFDNILAMEAVQIAAEQSGLFQSRDASRTNACSGSRR